jgi:hypothetical protein
MKCNPFVSLGGEACEQTNVTSPLSFVNKVSVFILL